jgi:hypothetical protein
MKFSTVDEARMFWICYGGQKGFEVRKMYTNKRKMGRLDRSCRYVCANEGHRKPDKRDHLTKRQRAETRTNCQVRIGLKVIGDPLEQTSKYSCDQFNRIGILCGHALKVLDLMNIKSLPTQYVLKRWTRETHSGTVQDSQGRDIIENLKLDNMLHYKDIPKFLNLAHQAASHPNCTLLVNKILYMLNKQVEEEIKGVTSPMDQQVHLIAPTNVSPSNEMLSTASLKKKEVETKTSKRKRTWLDKKRKFTKKEVTKMKTVQRCLTRKKKKFKGLCKCIRPRCGFWIINDNQIRD